MKIQRVCVSLRGQFYLYAQTLTPACPPYTDPYKHHQTSPIWPIRSPLHSQIRHNRMFTLTLIHIRTPTLTLLPSHILPLHLVSVPCRIGRLDIVNKQPTRTCVRLYVNNAMDTPTHLYAALHIQRSPTDPKQPYTSCETLRILRSPTHFFFFFGF